MPLPVRERQSWLEVEPKIHTAAMTIDVYVCMLNAEGISIFEFLYSIPIIRKFGPIENFPLCGGTFQGVIEPILSQEKILN